MLEDGADLARQLVQGVDDGVPARRHREAVLRELDRHHDEGDVLRSVGLGRSDTDFGSGVDVDTAVRLARDGRTDDVDHTNVESTTLEAVAHRENGVGGLAGLRDEDADVVTEDRGLAVEEVRGQLDRDRDLGKLLEDGTGLVASRQNACQRAGQRRGVTRS